MYKTRKKKKQATSSRENVYIVIIQTPLVLLFKKKINNHIHPPLKYHPFFPKSSQYRVVLRNRILLKM